MNSSTGSNGHGIDTKSPSSTSSPPTMSIPSVNSNNNKSRNTTNTNFNKNGITVNSSKKTNRIGAASGGVSPRLSSSSSSTTSQKKSGITPKNSLWARSNISRGLTVETSNGAVLASSSPPTTALMSRTPPPPTSINERLYHSPTKSSSSKQSPPLDYVPSLSSSSSPPRLIPTTAVSTKSSSSSVPTSLLMTNTPQYGIGSDTVQSFQFSTTISPTTATTGKIATTNHRPKPPPEQQLLNTAYGTTAATSSTVNGSRTINITSRNKNRDEMTKVDALQQRPVPATTTRNDNHHQLSTMNRMVNPEEERKQYCSCGINCLCRQMNHCDCCEELCQCRAYRIIQSLNGSTRSSAKTTKKSKKTNTKKKKNRATTTTGRNDSGSPAVDGLQPPNKKWKMEILVTGMTCSMCSQAVDVAIRKAFANATTTSHIISIDISLSTDIVMVEWMEEDEDDLETTTTTTSRHYSAEYYTDMIRTAITAIGYDVEDIQMIQRPVTTTTPLDGTDEEHPAATTTTSNSYNNHRNNDSSSNNTMSVEDRWQRYRQRQVDKVGQRRCAFVVAMILTLPILVITMILPYVVPNLFHHQKRIVIPWIHVSFQLEGFILWILATPVQFICGYEFYKMAWYGFWSGTAGMDLLVAIGTTASYLYALHGVLSTNTKDDTRNNHTTDTAHFFETSTILIVFVLAGKWMQAAAVRRTSDAITQLMSLQSPTAIRITSQQQYQEQQHHHQQQYGSFNSSTMFNPLVDPYMEEIVNVQDIAIGDMVKVIRGASIPVDGCVLFGDISVDESMMTGESLPVLKMKGSIVLGGTVCVESSSGSNDLASACGTITNQQTGSVGAAFIQVTGVGSSSALAKIVDLVQQAQSRAVPIQSFADRISAIFVPTVCAISLLTYLVWYALCSSNVVPAEWYRDELGEDSVTFSMMFAIACLVISCPCALGLATPTAIMVGTGVGAKCGILMKGGSALEVASKVNTVVFDKTGTLTKGVPAVCDLVHIPMNRKISKSSEEYILWVLGSLERTSEHPLAKAIVKYAEEQLGDTLETNPFCHPTDFQTITGRGASGVVGGKVEVAVGNRSFASIMGLTISEEANICMQRLEQVGKTAIIVALNGTVSIVLGIVDEVKDDAAASIAYLRDTMGMDVWMVTGDNARTAAAISQRIGLASNRVIAEALPATKLQKVRELQAFGSNIVCMVGDGINDSAALAQADVGIGMGTGADIATEASDMILVKGHVADVCTTLHLSRALFRRIQWNLTLSLIYNCLGIPVAVGVFYPLAHVRLPPTLAAVAMALSSVSVVLSSLTLRFYRPPDVLGRRSNVSAATRNGRYTTTQGDDETMRLALLSNDCLVEQSNNYSYAYVLLRASIMSTDIDEKESMWYQNWNALTYDRLETEMKKYRETQSLLQREWSAESTKYEEELTVTVKDAAQNDITITIPRRNYFSVDGTVSDVTLFPYHNALYPLLDAYDSLNVNIQHHSLFSVNATRPFAQSLSLNRLAFMDIDADDSPLFLPCSYEATSWTLGCYPGPDSRNRPDFVHGRAQFWFQMDFVLLDHRHSFPPYYRDVAGEEQYYEAVLEGMTYSSDDASYTTNAKKWYTTGPYGPASLPRDQKERTDLLLKVLRHALSEMQGDYKLAACVLVSMIRLRDPDDMSVFRQLLATIDSEYVPPSERNTKDWEEFHTSICFHVVHTGIVTFSLEISQCMSAFIRTTFLREFSALAPDQNEDSVIGKRKNLLVRAVVARQAEEYGEGDDNKNGPAGRIPIKFIETLIRSLGTRGHVERVNQFDHLDTLTQADEEGRKPLFRNSLASHENIVRTLVYVANTVIQILPEGERFYGIASELVLSLCRCLRKEEYFATFQGGIDEYHQFETNGYLCHGENGEEGVERLRPLRYSERVTNSTANMLAKRAQRRQHNMQPNESLAFMRDEFVEFFIQGPKQDVLDAVRGLFLRNLVDIRMSALGYGDFLILCDFEITPVDPMLVWTEFAYPDEEGSDDDDDDEEDDESLDEGDRPADWVQDEVGAIMTYNDLRARNYLQFLLLVRAWQAPWTPETHASFQPPFRAAIETLAKSTHRVGYPHEVMLSICSYLNRDWWEDTRKECWNFACACEKNLVVITLKMSLDYNSATSDSILNSNIQMQPCPHCQVALYCSKGCKTRDLYLGHKGKCDPDLSKSPNNKEIQLYKKIFVGSDSESTLPAFLEFMVQTACEVEESTALDDVQPVATENDVQMQEVDDADDDDESWETMDSEEDVVDRSTMSITKLVRRYFDD